MSEDIYAKERERLLRRELKLAKKENEQLKIENEQLKNKIRILTRNPRHQPK